MDVPLGLLSSWFQTREIVFDSTRDNTIPLLLPDPRRWAIWFQNHGSKPASFGLLPAPPLNDGFTIIFQGAPILMYFTQVGTLVQQAWYGGVGAPGAASIVEVIYQPPYLLGEEPFLPETVREGA